MIATQNWVKSLLAKFINFKRFFCSVDDSIESIKFGMDADGNYGYYKDGADSVTPFKTDISGLTALGTARTGNTTACSVSYTNSDTKSCVILVVCAVTGASSSTYSPTTTNYACSYTGTKIAEKLNYIASASINAIQSIGIYKIDAGTKITASCHSNKSTYNSNVTSLYKINY